MRLRYGEGRLLLDAHVFNKHVKVNLSGVKNNNLTLILIVQSFDAKRAVAGTVLGKF